MEESGRRLELCRGEERPRPVAADDQRSYARCGQSRRRYRHSKSGEKSETRRGEEVAEVSLPQGRYNHVSGSASSRLAQIFSSGNCAANTVAKIGRAHV